MPQFPFRYRRPSLAEILAGISERARVWSASDVAQAVNDHAPVPDEYSRPNTSQIQSWTNSTPFVWAPVDVRNAAKYHGSSTWAYNVGESELLADTTAAQSIYSATSFSLPFPVIGDEWQEETWGRIIPDGATVGLSLSGRIGGPSFSVAAGGITADSTFRLSRRVLRNGTNDYTGYARLEVTPGVGGGGGSAGTPLVDQRTGSVTSYFSQPDFLLNLTFGAAYGATTKAVIEGCRLTYTPRRT